MSVRPTYSLVIAVYNEEAIPACGRRSPALLHALSPYRLIRQYAAIVLGSRTVPPVIPPHLARAVQDTAAPPPRGASAPATSVGPNPGAAANR